MGLIRADFYKRVPDREEDPMRYSVFPPLGGFLPWGRAPNAPWGRPIPDAGYPQQWCDWMTSAAPPDEWGIAVRIEAGYGSNGVPFVEFLIGLLEDRYGVFPEMDPWPKPVAER